MIQVAPGIVTTSGGVSPLMERILSSSLFSFGPATIHSSAILLLSRDQAANWAICLVSPRRPSLVTFRAEPVATSSSARFDDDQSTNARCLPSGDGFAYISSFGTSRMVNWDSPDRAGALPASAANRCRAAATSCDCSP